MFRSDRTFLEWLLACLFAIVPTHASSLPGERTHVEGQVLVCFRATNVPEVRSTALGPAFGFSRVDSVLGACGVVTARGFVEGYDPTTVPLARTYLISCSPEVDEGALCAYLRSLPEVEDATPNLILRKEYGATRTMKPDDATTRFDDQWYLHDPNNDSADIDAPEAWAITRGSSDVVIGIHDSGIMVDLSAPGCFELHGDLAYYWTTENVGHPTLCFNNSDIDSVDSGDSDDIPDNVIGYNFAPHWEGETDLDIIARWRAIPSDWVLEGSLEDPTSMNCRTMNPHGTFVASIAAGLWTNGNPIDFGGDIVGVANECPVYIVRAGGDDIPSPLSDEIAALRHAAEYARVINMSWGYDQYPGDIFRDTAINFAANTKDCVLVSITHNDDLEDFVSWPAAFPNVLAVGAINRDLTLCSYIQADTIRVAPDIRNLGSDASRVEIIVKGTLKVLGTSGNPVVFESFTDSSPTETDWVGFKFEPGSKGILQHVSIRNATQDVVVSRPSVSVSSWDEKKTLYLDSDLSITSDMTIATDEDLYVLGTSDVIVTAGSGVDLTVNGSLICRGVGTKRPEFRSSSGAARSWGIITLSALSSGHTLHNAIIRDAQLAVRSYVPVTIDSCLIRSAVDGIQSYANVIVWNTTMHDFTGSALVWLAGNLELKNLDVYDAAYGLHQSTATSTGTLVCRKTSFRDIDYRGIDVPSSSAGITIKQTTIRGATDGIFLAYQTSAAVDSCELRANDIGVAMLLSSGTSIKHCDVDSNATSGIYLVAYTHATMEFDTVAHSPVGVYCYTSNPSIQTSRLLSNTTGLKCESNADPIVRTTRIQSGVTGVLALDGSAPDLGVATGGICGSGGQEGLNSIQSNSSYNVSNLDAGETVNAQCNWWGGTPSGSKFYGNVIYSPYKSTDPNPAGFIDEPEPGDQPPPRVPTAYALHANRPNPFNPATTIGYDVPAPGGRVDVAIYDVSGRLVRVLVAGHRAPGTHSATWEGQDDRDTRVASGVYFVRMTSGSFAQTRKLVLLK